MARTSIAEALRSGRVLVSDGAWGTELYRRGLAKGACPELWCVDHPDEVRDIAAGYIAAGADMVGTNSFGANRFRLAAYGLAERAAELGEAAARLSREAAGGSVWVIGSMGPTGMFLRRGEGTEPEMSVAFAEQAEALARGGADALCVETMMDAEEAAVAVRAAKEAAGLEVICTFTFDRAGSRSYRTMTGLSPEEAAAAAVAAGADIVGANCGRGFAEMEDVMRAMAPASRGRPLIAQPNAGLPRSANGVDVYAEGPAELAAVVPALIDAGARIVGGCCGTTAAHIAAIRAVVDMRRATHGKG
jgi:5-methyltetrahydrofolate--homocysteine methyltransferase